MITRIRDSHWMKIAVVVMILEILLTLVVQPEVYAITGGPDQPEFTTFTPVGTSGMVDPFTGDFSYNIPLMNVGGYPINLSYAAGITMEQQASIVGLGWNLNAGGIVKRSLRGIPDDFNGTDEIVNTTSIRPDITVGANVTVGDIEVFGFSTNNELKTITGNLSLGAGLFYNNYNGIGLEANVGGAFGASSKNGTSQTLGLGISSNSDNGIGVKANVGLNFKHLDVNSDATEALFKTGNARFGVGYHSRAGLKSLTAGYTMDKTRLSAEKVKETNASLNTSIPIGLNTYIPQNQVPMRNTSVAIDFGTGLEAFWVNGKLKLGGYFNTQVVDQPTTSNPAYGYFYSNLGSRNVHAMHDFNREKDGEFNKNTPRLPVTQMTYDIFSVMGQGIGGMYRPHRDFGTVFDPMVTNTSGGGALGLDLGATNLLKGGVNASGSYTFINTGAWNSSENFASIGASNATRHELNFKGRNGGNDPNLYESYYMKPAGEFTVMDNDYFNRIRGYDPVRLEITRGGRTTGKYQIRNSFDGESEDLSLSNVQNNARTQRDKRNQPMTILTAEEASAVGLERDLRTYRINMSPLADSNDVNMYPNDLSIERDDGDRENHHISEMTITKTDGSRYVFGQQTYNLHQLETTFNVDKGDNQTCINELTGTVGYQTGDDTRNNSNGKDNYFNSTQLPAYANAFLLTAWLSHDYVDIDNNGPSPQDLGNYTKFNYTTIHSAADPYKWRDPYVLNTTCNGDPQANFRMGYKTKNNDDKGSYIYGEKEIKLLHSIETKNYVAEFYYSDRKDAFEAMSKNGGIGGKTLKKLDRIELYNRCDREFRNVKDSKSCGVMDTLTNATPLKIVHLEYDYSLCQGLPSNDNSAPSGCESEIENQGGKLTLKKVYFTYERSNKGQLSPYVFDYGNNNPNYALKSSDRWGCYKPNVSSDEPTNPQGVNNNDNPYVEQEKALADGYATSWSLKEIKLPSGGLITVDIESDDYAYVQNKRATSMFRIKGVSNSSLGLSNADTNSDGINSNELYTGDQNNLFIYFDAPDATANDFHRKYMGQGTNDDDEIKELYYRVLIDVTGEEDYEYVPGYATVESSGFIPNNFTGQHLGWIKLKDTKLKDFGLGMNEINPISKTAIQFVRTYLPEYVLGRNPEENTISEAIFYELVGLIGDLPSLLLGQKKAMKNKDIGRAIIPDKSFIRLQTPNYSKLGGGCRVSKIAISDSWGQISGNDVGDFDYAQTYDYTMESEDPRGSIPTTEIISSGVAEYEPLVGNDENPLKQPFFHGEDRKMVPKNSFYQEYPYGEMFFPAASVGYSQVKVRNIERTNVNRTATGHTIHKFYTAKDFPVITQTPKIKRKPNPASRVLQLLNVNVVDFMTVSQGNAIELNDMHGKAKEQAVYSEEGDEISKVRYIYKQQNSKQLDNTIDVIDKAGNVSERQAGIDIDMTIDERESNSETYLGEVPFNLDVSFLPVPFPFPPIPIPTIWGMVGYEHKRFRSITNTKVITRYGILDEVIATDLGSTIATKNLAWDSETGGVLLTSAQNGHDDPVYSFTYPAHWGYDGMGQAYKNIAAEVDDFSALSSPQNYFAPGDEVLVNGTTKAWVIETGGNLSLIDEVGTPVNNPQSVKVVRSGRRNQAPVPIGTIATLSNPITNSNTLEFKDVVEAGAIEFKEEWEAYCPCDGDLNSTNPYVTGTRGNYRSLRSFAFLTERTQSNENRNTNTRKDGVFENFDPFWNSNFTGSDWSIDSTQWTFASEVTRYSPYGFELENRDALGRYSAAEYRYNNTLPVAVASNSRYQEMGFENFESDTYAYGCGACASNRLSFENAIICTEGHTGRESIELFSNTSITLEGIVEPAGN